MRTAVTTVAMDTGAHDHATADAATDSGLDPLLRRPLRDPLQTGNTAADRVPTRIDGVVIGRIADVDRDGVLVALPGLHAAPLPARLLCPLPANWSARPCAVLFENGDPTRPMVIGLVMDLPVYDEPAQELPESAPEFVADQAPEQVSEQDRELRVDGKRVVIEAGSELELRCGESVILLLRDGRIEIRGNYITSQATATQRLRGGSIHMN